MKRGAFEFDVSSEGDLMAGSENAEKLRRLWLDRNLIRGRDLGPGNPGDFDYGAWHVGCHLVAAGGVKRASDGRLLWLEISHDPAADSYFVSVTARIGPGAVTLRIDSPEGRDLLAGARLLGFLEGNSTGRISARTADDPPDRFNGWRRQDFNHPSDSDREGGKVWEHWCTLRDIRPSARIGVSVISAYLSLAAALGDRLVPAVTRGRRSYGHPQQLCAMVRAGLTSEESALWETTPLVLPSSVENLLLQAEPSRALEAVELLDWTDQPCYYMFARRIRGWSAASAVRRDLRNFHS